MRRSQREEEPLIAPVHYRDCGARTARTARTSCTTRTARTARKTRTPCTTRTTCSTHSLFSLSSPPSLLHAFVSTPVCLHTTAALGLAPLSHCTLRCCTGRRKCFRWVQIRWRETEQAAKAKHPAITHATVCKDSYSLFAVALPPSVITDAMCGRAVLVSVPWIL